MKDWVKRIDVLLTGLFGSVSFIYKFFETLNEYNNVTGIFADDIRSDCRLELWVLGVCGIFWPFATWLGFVCDDIARQVRVPFYALTIVILLFIFPIIAAIAIALLAAPAFLGGALKKGSDV